MLTLVCDNCGSLFNRKKRGKAEHLFCTYECFQEFKKRTGFMKKREKIVCATCGKLFFPKDDASKYCSKECAGQVTREPDTVCPVCGKLFVSNDDHRKYCCRKCSDVGRRKFQNEEERKQHEKDCKRAEYARKREREKPLREARQAERERLKAERDAERERHRIELELAKLHPCPVCGTITDRKKYCSDACCKRAFNNRSRNRRDARIRDALVDRDISLMDVYKNDMGFCYICGRFCSWDDTEERDGTIICGNTYPSIDHVIPLSKGGKHSWQNVRLACRKCNSIKSDSIPPAGGGMLNGERAPGGELFPSPGLI